MTSRRYIIKDVLSDSNARGKRARTRSVNGIDGDIKLNKRLWVIIKKCLEKTCYMLKTRFECMIIKVD